MKYEISGWVKVAGRAYEDGEIAELIGQDITGWHASWEASDVGAEDCDFALWLPDIQDSEVFSGPEALPRLLARLAALRPA